MRPNESSGDFLTKIRRKSVAVVYTFQNEDSPGFGHYDYWTFGVVSDWVRAVEQLGCVPYVLDVRTFGHKALNGTLPPVDFIVNLNAGNLSLSTLGVVPSLAGFLDIPCLPNAVLATVAGESKGLSNKVAEALGLNVPAPLSASDPDGIFKPDNLGSSRGVTKGKVADPMGGLYQSFIPGVDFTVPFLHNPRSGRLEALPGIAYLPENGDVNWFLGDEEKKKRAGYQKVAARIDAAVAQAFRSLAEQFQINTLCRIDTRLRCDSMEQCHRLLAAPISMNALYFIEINAMPTICEGMNFCNALDVLDSTDPLAAVFQDISGHISGLLKTTFVLYCAMRAHMR